ncbi:STAS domain-containing protein [Caulobacter vibrioides]|uniref:STAS domain-containing protein n=1 Tax=Caulobacter vibrioides TaxID=155892 RepID=UPI0015E6B412|nr:STAS domain-containing protein [Caulobacter vibrioides]
MSDTSEYIVSFSGNLTVSSIAEAYAALTAGMELGGPVVVNLDAVEEADLTLPQLLEAARRTAAAKGQLIRLEKPAQGLVLQVLQRGGFLNSDDANRLDFWTGESRQL